MRPCPPDRVAHPNVIVLDIGVAHPSEARWAKSSNEERSSMRAFAAVLTLTTVLAACGGEPQDGTQAPEASTVSPSDSQIDFERVAANILLQLDLQAGERVLLVGVPGRFDGLVQPLRDGITAAGAVDLGAFAEAVSLPPEWETDFIADLHEARDEQLGGLLADVDAAVMMPGANTGHRIYAAMQDVLRGESGRTVHFHWLGAYDIDGAERAIDGTVDAFYQEVLAETDYTALAEVHMAFEQAMRGSTVRVTTPAGTDISFQIGDRPVTKQDGNASAARASQGRNLIDREIELPAGAVRVAPIEESVNGTIVFPPSEWGGGESTENLTLDFERGVMTSLDADVGAEAARAEIDNAGPAGRAFREFALGFNPLLAIPTEGESWIPYYGYGAGVVRLSLGDNTELGGNVGGGHCQVEAGAGKVGR